MAETTVIGRATFVRGRVNGGGDLEIAGRLEGDVTLAGEGRPIAAGRSRVEEREQRQGGGRAPSWRDARRRPPRAAAARRTRAEKGREGRPQEALMTAPRGRLLELLRERSFARRKV